ncbi:MAG: GNAT family N-acetyltransferase [Nanoarchaeota archaeon]|nr:GNAT family N-acetyltransferase [Nanoarchaeota archaeon]
MIEEPIYFRFATKEDLKDIYNWRNDKQTRQVSFNSKKISLNEHKEWFNKAINNAYINIFIITKKNGDKIGQIRFNKNKNKKQTEISIMIGPEYRGQGYGTRILIEGTKLFFNNFDATEIIAKIKNENTASLRVFEKTGFQKYKLNSKQSELKLKKNAIRN